MKPKVSIIGAGQSGLLLGIALLKANYHVTIISDKTADEIYRGNILSNQAMFNTALSIERKYELNFWDDISPRNYSFEISVANPNCNERGIRWTGYQKSFFQSVDQRLKFSTWLNKFEAMGGTLLIKTISTNDLESIANSSSLTIVASGKGEISRLFQRDNERSIFNTPQRNLCCIYVKGMPIANGTPGVRVNLIPGMGEYLIMQGLTKDNICSMMQFEAQPGQAFDTLEGNQDPNDLLHKIITLIQKYIPWEAEYCNNLTLNDKLSTLTGRITPIIRHPVAQLPSGVNLLGMGDTVVLNDPLAGQGANNATINADYYFESIVDNTNNRFSADWMQQTFNTYWDKHAQWSTAWSNMLLSPPPTHILQYFQAAEKNVKLANLLSEGFNNPKLLFPWITDAELTNKMIQSYSENQFEAAST